MFLLPFFLTLFPSYFSSRFCFRFQNHFQWRHSFLPLIPFTTLSLLSLTPFFPLFWCGLLFSSFLYPAVFTPSSYLLASHCTWRRCTSPPTRNEIRYIYLIELLVCCSLISSMGHSFSLLFKLISLTLMPPASTLTWRVYIYLIYSFVCCSLISCVMHFFSSQPTH